MESAVGVQNKPTAFVGMLNHESGNSYHLKEV